MTYEEVSERASKIFGPKLRALKRDFAKDARNLRYQPELKDWEKEGRAREIASAFIRAQLTAIAAGIHTVLTARHTRFEEQEIHRLFDDLCPAVDDVKKEIHAHYQGMLPATGLLIIDMESAYEETSQIERETLGLLAQDQSSLNLVDAPTSAESLQSSDRTAIPPISELMNLSAEDIGMFLLPHFEGPHANRETEWMLRWISKDHYDDNPTVLQPLSEGVQYLEREGLVVLKVHSGHPGKKVLELSRRGRDLLEERRSRKVTAGESIMLSITKILPTPADVLGLSREELAGCILELLNAEAATHYHGEENYKEHQRNYLRAVDEAYKSREVADRFNSPWRWLIEHDYLTEDIRDLSPGWYRLTAQGRAIKKRGQVAVPPVPRDVSPGPPPDFGPLTADDGLQKQLLVLWQEAVLCHAANAHLATVVMLGSLLEGALLGKVLANPAAANRAAASPKEASGAVRPFDRWFLSNFIDVAIECGWIHQTRGDFSDVLREYRNLVHPFKAKGAGYRIDRGTASICWQVVISTLDDLGITTRV